MTTNRLKWIYRSWFRTLFYRENENLKEKLKAKHLRRHISKIFDLQFCRVVFVPKLWSEQNL